jgi:hypothetical protein
VVRTQSVVHGELAVSQLSANNVCRHGVINCKCERECLASRIEKCRGLEDHVVLKKKTKGILVWVSCSDCRRIVLWYNTCEECCYVRRHGGLGTIDSGTKKSS